MILIVNKYLLGKSFKGVSLWPFVILKNRELKDDFNFINHEKIHLRQQLELLILPFYIWYLTEYLLRLFYYKDRFLAYKNISFEREAYSQEMKENYLQDRKFWAFLQFV
ncbi:hypothetical protein APR41_11680 [Salegentibacter salinarum]|uniref:Peptidase M56 domain-containing protein n=1 Tax=Salegentibacter salinarum TaxID=447422 RepID=A0A2N0U249_9FLAO|nr:hypothetical protein APR41_11680 [Salegentibacter salinarum]SKB75531.1 hypothetical protein SAMN05660903_02382 [Salegentibacter salinarum]